MKYPQKTIKKTTQRTGIFEYPLEAIRELVLNAIIHRKYNNPIDIQINPVRYNQL